MPARVSRSEQTEQNRERLLAAARRIFVAKGFDAATLDQIAEEAGLSKGAVYSQFESKADVFLTLLERRISERAERQRKLAEALRGLEDLDQLFAAVARISSAEPAWTLLVIEFRVVAARDRKLNRRYAALHRRAIEGVADVLRIVYERSGIESPAPLETVAAQLLALGNGVALEEAVTNTPPAAAEIQRLFRALLGAPPANTRRRRVR
jgi:AcrR family transcriptional regulator